MDSSKRNNESEMGSGDSDDEFYNVKLPYTPEVASEKPGKKVEVKKVYSPPRTKVQYNYKFDSSSDEEAELRGRAREGQAPQGAPEGPRKRAARREEGPREKGGLSQSTCKVVEKINEELRSMKNCGSKVGGEKGENHVGAGAGVGRSVGVVPPVVVVPPPMVVQQASVMGPMLVPSGLGMGGPMAMMSSQSVMMRGGGAMGLASGALSGGVMGVSSVPGMVGVAGGMLSPAAMMAGGMVRMPGAGGGVFRVQGPGGGVVGVRGGGGLVGVARSGGNLMVGGPGGLMVMGGIAGGLMGSAGAGGSVVRMVGGAQGGLSIRVPPPPPFLSFRGRPPVPPGSLRWQAGSKVQGQVGRGGSPSTSSPSASSPSSSPLGKSGRDYDGEEYCGDDKEKSGSDSDESESPPREVPNTFKNDGSFMEMFKKMTEESESKEEAGGSQEKASGSGGASEPASTLKRPTVMLSGIVGKRRGGRVLKTGLVKKVKKGGDADEEKHPKDAWSMYMAEVKKYREASCEEEGKTRPLVK